MPELRNYYFELFHRDVEPIVNSSNLWSVQGQYVIDDESFGYTNWISDESAIQTAVPNGENVAMHIITDTAVSLDMDVVAHSIELGEQATLNLDSTHSMRIIDHFAINGLVSVFKNSLTNASEDALQLTGTGMLNLSGNGTSGALGSTENRSAFNVGKDLSITTKGYSDGFIYANLINTGTVTTDAGNLYLKGNAVENTGFIVTGGRIIIMENATVNGIGTLNGANGDVQLYGTIVNNGTLTGKVRTLGENACTLNGVTVDDNGTVELNTLVIAQGTLTLNGKINIWNGKSLSTASAEDTVSLTGTGTLNLSGNGSTGSLGGEDNRGAFSIGKDLTVTTQGYSDGFIYANIANNGIITTEAGNLYLKGNTVENTGSIVTGGDRFISLQSTTVNGGTLNGKAGTVYLNGSTLAGVLLKGGLRAETTKSTLKNATLDADAVFTQATDVALQETFAINGTASVQGGGHLINEATDDTVVSLTGTGTLNLNGNGSTGSLGDEDKRGAFNIGKDLTLTTQGYSDGFIYANLTNNGTITTEAGNLYLKGNTVENTGSIVTGGSRYISLQSATVNGGTLNGKDGTVYLNGSTLVGVLLKGGLRAETTKSTLKNATLDADAVFTQSTDVALQETFAINGTASVQGGSHLINEATDGTAVSLTGTGTLNLNGNGSTGSLGSKDNRGAFDIGKDLTLTTQGYSDGFIYANLTNNGTIATEAGNLYLNGNTVENKGSIVTGGSRSVSLENATLNGGTLNGKDGTVYLNGSTLTDATLKGQLRATDKKVSLKNVTVDIDGKFTQTTDVALLETFAINGTASIQSGSHLVNETADTFVKLTGIGTLNLSANGSTGYLGGNDTTGGFEFGEDLTLTTLGYSTGYILAGFKNHGLITTSQGELNIVGCTVENHGSIVTGGRNIFLTDTTVTGKGALNGANGTVYLTNTVIDGAAVAGLVRAQAGTTMKSITVAAESRFDITGSSSTEGIQIDGILTVSNNAKLLSSGDKEVLLSGTGTIGLGGNGSSGYLGDADSKFELGEGLTLTTPGYSTGYIHADVTNRGEIVTDQGELIITGTDEDPVSFRNAGTIRGGGRAITLTKAAVNNAGGSVIGEDSTVYVGAGATLTGGMLGGKVQVSGAGAAVVLDDDSCIQDGKITVSGNGSFTAKNMLAQADINVGSNGTLVMSNVAMAGTINAATSNIKQLFMTGVSGIFTLALDTGAAAACSLIGNDLTNAVITIQGGGNIDLSGNYWGGLTDEAEIRAKYGLGNNVNVGDAMATAPTGREIFLTGAELANGKYLSLAQEALKLDFLLDLDPQTITEDTVQLWDDSRQQQISLADRLPAVEGNRLVFDNALFEEGHSYRVVLTDGIKSTDGSTLNTDFKGSVSFTVDRNAPKVVNIEKTVNITGKLPDFRITFSSDVDVATLRSALKVTSPDEQNVGVDITMLSDAVALVTAKAAINVPGEYTVSIDAAKVTDKAGNHLQESFTGAVDMTRINLDISDLAVSKDSVTQGEAVTVQWKTFNREEADLYGKWSDGVYLSKDNLWDNSDILLASVAHYNGLPQGDSVSGQTQISLSGVVDGSYYLLVRPDIYNEKPTGASERNVKSVAVSVSTEALPDGQRTIRSGGSATYKFTAAAGKSYQLALDTLRDDYEGMELYVGYGYAPTRETYDTAVRNVNDTQLSLATLNYDQDVYVMLYARNGGGDIGYTLTAKQVGLEITSVTPGTQNIPDGQPLTFVVDGLCFTPGTAVVAVNAAEQTFTGMVTYVSDQQLLLTFDPGTLAEGDYVLKATDGEASALSETVTLTSAGAPILVVTADLPQRIGNHLITSFDVNYANTGDASMGAVLLTVNIYEVDKDGNKTRSVGIMGMNKSVDQNHTAYNGSYSALPTGYVSTAAIYAQGKVPGQLEAGASGSVTIGLVGLLQPWNVNGDNNLLWEINYFDENSTEALDWRETMPGQSDEFYLAMQNTVGTTWGDYVKMLQRNAMTLQSVGADASNATDLLQLTVQSVSGAFNPYATVEAVTDLSVATSGSLQLNYGRFYSNCIDDRGWHTNWEYSLKQEENGALTFYSPETGVYTFRKDAYGKYFCENDTDLTLKFKGGRAILQDAANERTWTMDQVNSRNWRLAQVADTHGSTITLKYDKDGSLAKLTSSDGEFILVSKDGLTGSNGITVTYRRSEDGRLLGVICSDGSNPLTYQYNGDLLTEVLVGDMPVSSYRYDENGTVVQATNGNLVTDVLTEAPGVITVTDNCDHSFTAVYYADGNLAKLTDNVSGDWISCTYDSNGWRHTLTSSAGIEESYVYNANGDMLRYTDRYGGTSSYTYFQGHLKTAENATGYAVNISYDQDWNITGFTYSDGSVVTFAYDAGGNLTGITDPLGNVLTCDYDDSRRISKVTYGAYSFALTYDNFGNIATVTQNGHTVAYGRNNMGQITSLTDANGNQARLTYDGNFLLTEAVFADGSKQSWGYDAEGNVASSTTRAGDVIVNNWTADGLLSGTAVGGTRYLYAYNNAGRLTGATDTAMNQNLSFDYNARGELTGITGKDGTSVSIERDNLGRVDSYTVGGQTFAYTWQGDKLSSVSVNGSDFAAYTRNAEGILTGGSGIVYEYDAVGNITKVGATEYTYNSVYQIIRKDTAEGTWTYTYDLDGNLTGEMLGDGTEINLTYAYDGAGNRLTKKDVVSGVTTAWTYGSMNQILSVRTGDAEAVEYTYDLNGNLLSDGRAVYTWTEDSCMATMTVGGTTWTYTYNALGFRDSASDGTDTFTFCYDATGNLLAQFKNGAAYQVYIRGASGIEGYVDAEGAVYTFTYDLGGNVTAVSGSNGKSATYTYDAFGNIIGQTGDITDNALTWHGHFGTLMNPDGSYYVLARNYSAADGRFISTDPSLFSDGANLYTYAYNDPVNYLDLNGMKGDPTSLPTKHEEGSFLDYLAHPEKIKIFNNLNNKLNNADLTSNLKTSAPKIGTGDAPNEWFDAMKAASGKGVPKACKGVADYYKGGINVAKSLYEKGTVSTKDGTVWPSKFATELDDPYISHFFTRFQNATTRSAKEEAVQMAWRRWHQLQDKNKSGKSQPKGGTSATSANTQSASSHDPNDKLATKGVTDLHCVLNGDRLEYTVLFENDPENATAPARKVLVRDVMDANLDLNTFRLYSFTLAGYTYQLPEGRDSFNGQVILDLGDAQITVAVAINLDEETRELIASFTAIDPETGFELQDLTKGVLLINDDSGRGEGNLNYTIQTMPGLPGGTQIKNTAEIFFDFNDPIDTPTTLNTIDAAAPSTPAGLQALVAYQTVTLSWTASTDDASGVKEYIVKYSHDDQEFTATTAETTLVLENVDFATWQWSVQAVDNIGFASETTAGDAFVVDQAAPGKKFVTQSDIDANGVSDVMFVWTGNNYQHGYWMNGTSDWQSAGSSHPAEWENLGCYDMTGNGKADSVLVGNVVVNEVKGAYIGFYTDAVDNPDGSTWQNIGYLTNADDIAWKNKVGNLTGNEGANSIVWYAPELYAVGAWTDGTDSWVTLSNSFGGDDWTLVGCGDFDGDGKDSVLMSGLNGQYLYSVGIDGVAQSLGSANWSGWEVRAIGDFKGDGKDDLVLFHLATGSMVMCADGSVDSFVSLAQLDAEDWFVVGAGDYNGDQKDDLLVRQYSTGMLGYYNSGDTSQWVELGRGVDMNWTVIA